MQVACLTNVETKIKMKRNYMSGSKKRQLAEEKRQKSEEIVSTCPKLTSFFQPNESLPGSSASTVENIVESVRNVAAEDHSREIQDVPIVIDNNDDNSATHDLTVNHNNRIGDPGKWTIFEEDDVRYWVDQGPHVCQNHSGPFKNSRRTFQDGKQIRFCSPTVFQGTKANGEKYKREWLLYSPSNGSVYCFVCKLFPPKILSRLVTGFSDWRNNGVIDQHENSPNHREAMLTYVTRRKGTGLKSQLDDQFEKELGYWCHVVHRVIAVIQTLAERGLAFRGSDENFGSENNGNYLGLLELIAKFDPFLASHISNYGNRGKGNFILITVKIHGSISIQVQKIKKKYFKKYSIEIVN